MGSGLSVVVNIIQILSFEVQLVQAGPDLVGVVPGFVRSVYRFARERMSELDDNKRLSSELIPCDADVRDAAFALEEGRVGGEQAVLQSSLYWHRTW
jgi:hypothetical protein